MGKIVLVLVALAALVGSACGGGSDGSSASPSSAAGGSSDCIDLTSGATFTITIQDFAFHPDCFTAKASQGISVVNKDGALHSFTIDGTQIDVDVQPGTTFKGEPVTGVVAPGTYDFHCKYHSSMTGKVTVE